MSCAVAPRGPRRLVHRYPRQAHLDSFEFKAIPSLNKARGLELARCEWIERRENVIALGPSGTGKSHAAQRLGLAACQRGMSVRFVTAAALVHELLEARDERRLVRLQKQLANHKLLIIDELGFVPLSKTGAELLFELVSQRYERAAVLTTSNLPFDEWTETFGSERLTGALLDRLTHHVHILEMNGESFRLNHSRAPKEASAGRTSRGPEPETPVGLRPPCVSGRHLAWIRTRELGGKPSVKRDTTLRARCLSARYRGRSRTASESAWRTHGTDNSPVKASRLRTGSRAGFRVKPRFRHCAEQERRVQKLSLEKGDAKCSITTPMRSSICRDPTESHT